MPKSPAFDIVLFGATSFVGQILTQRFVERFAQTGLRWAIAGRNAQKLAQVAAQTGARVESLVVDANDAGDMRRLVESTRAVVSTVGPYALYGATLVEAAADAGTHYCDLTGEPHFMRQMIDAHHPRAQETGARIVHACGFDSIPSDLGTFTLQQAALERLGEPCVKVELRVKAAKGGASGGTIASMLTMAEQMQAQPELRKVLGNPYALCPDGMRKGPRQPNVMLPTWDARAGKWLGPFVMAATNAPVVQRTHALLGRPWGGEAFRYDEAMWMGSGPMGAVRAAAMSGGLAATLGLAGFGPTRGLLERALPSPGEGPSPEQQRAGFFDIRLHGETAGGSALDVRVTGDRDPGYGSTAKMLAEAAVCLLDAKVGGGFWTPATAFGDALVDRLVAHAGLTFDVV